MALSPAVHIVAQRRQTIMLRLFSVLNIVYHSCLRKARESHGTNFQKLIPRDSLFSHEFLRFWHGVFLQFHFPRCNKSPSYRSSQGFMFMRMYVVFLDFVHPTLLQFFHFITFGAGNQMDSLQDMMECAPQWRCALLSRSGHPNSRPDQNIHSGGLPSHCC